MTSYPNAISNESNMYLKAKRTSDMCGSEAQKKTYALILLFFMFGESINYFINFFIQNVLGKGVSVSLLCYGLLTVLGLYCLIVSCVKKPMCFFIYAAVVLFALLSKEIYPETTELFSNFFNPAYNCFYMLIVYCLPICFFTLEYWSAIRIYVVKYLYYFVVPCLAMGLLNWFFILTRRLGWEYMTYSYNLLMSVIACFCSCRYHKKWFVKLFFIIFGLVGLGCIFISGARGAFLCCLIALFLLYLTSKINPVVKAIVTVLFLILIIYVFLDFNHIVSMIISALKVFGIRLRTLEFLSTEGLFESDGRRELQQLSIDGIINNPFGYGLYGDHHVTNSYPHNIVLELILDFGVILGSFILLWIFYSLLRSFSSSDKTFIVIISSYGLFHLFFSGSFMWHIPFFIMIAVFMNVAKRRREFARINNWR